MHQTTPTKKNRASPTAGEPGAFFNAHPTKPKLWLHFSMTPRLPYGQPPTGSTRSKQPPRPAGLGGRLTPYIKNPTDARTHPHPQRSMSHRKIQRAKVTSPARRLTVSPGGHSNSIHPQPPLNKPKGDLPPQKPPHPEEIQIRRQNKKVTVDVLVQEPLAKDFSCNVISVPTIPPRPWVSNNKRCYMSYPRYRTTVRTRRGPCRERWARTKGAPIRPPRWKVTVVHR